MNKLTKNPTKKTVMISFLGTVLDAGLGKKRWKRWRPNVDIHQCTSIDVVELFVADKFVTLGEKIKQDIAEISPNTSVNLIPMDLDNPWDFSEVYEKLSDWAAVYPFDTQTYQYWTHITTGTHVAQICLFLLVESRQIPSVLLQTAPPKKTEDSTTHLGEFELIDLDLTRYDNIAKRLAQVKNDAQKYLKNNIATKNLAFNQMIAEIQQVAMNSSAPILLMGETGVGKSLLAKRIFELKKARHLISGQLIDVNCATLKGDGAMSALFGHGKGAFTGAVLGRDGYLKSADKGVLFLDEIGELGLDEQAMLLKAIEDKQFYPLGLDKPVSSDFILIAGTNKNLQTEVSAGRFRADLYARINIWQYHLPKLFDRKEDIAPNIDHQLILASTEVGQKVQFDKLAYQLYLEFALSSRAIWSGNFRDLSASILRMATLNQQGFITQAIVKKEITRLNHLWHGDNCMQNNDEILSIIPANLDVFDKIQLEKVLQICRHYKANNGSLAEAGRALFDVSRNKRKTTNDSDRLRKYLARFGISWEKI